MAQEPPHQPHDKLFKAGFGDPLNAAGFLEWQLPETLALGIDWPRLRLESGSFVDSQFRHSESDLLFSAPLRGRPCLIYLLFEHQRTFDPWIALRLLRYMVRIWEECLRKKPARLPLIVPVVLAQNARRWELSPDFASLLEIPPGGSEFVPNFAFRLVQLAEIPFKKIAGTPAGILVLRALKAEQTGELLGEDLWDEELIAQDKKRIFQMILRYILSAPEIDKETFTHRVRELKSADLKETAMTLAQQFRQEGHQEGLLLGQRRAVLEALQIRFALVPDTVRAELAQITDSRRLDALHRAAIRCETLESFVRELKAES